MENVLALLSRLFLREVVDVALSGECRPLLLLCATLLTAESKSVGPAPSNQVKTIRRLSHLVIAAVPPSPFTGTLSLG
jgi:hypothetical protein